MCVMKFLKNNNGETIAETLVATLIAALSMVMFAGMVMASKTIVDTTNKKIVKYYDGFSQLISKDDVIDKNLGPMTFFTNKNGMIYYDYDNTKNNEGSEEAGDSGGGT